MQLFEAELDGYELNILDISDSLASALARHEFVNSNGCIIENMGKKPREIRFKAFFFGAASATPVSPNYFNHIKFVEEITDTRIIHTLTHPKYGRIKGHVGTVGIVHDDTQDYVVIEITYIEDGLGAALAPTKESLAYIAKQHQIANLNAQIAAIRSELSALGHSGLLGKVIDKSKTLLQNFNTISNKTRSFVKSIDSFVTKLDTFLGTIERPVATINTAVNYIGDLPSTVLGKVQDCTDRVVASFANLSNQPVSLVNNSIMSLRSLAGSITGENADFFRTKLIAVGAGSISAKAAELMDSDQRIAESAKRAESSRVFDVNGKRVSSLTVSSIMSSTELDALVYSVGGLIQESIDLDRDAQPLKNMYASLVSYLDTAKLDRMRQVSMQLNNIPLHVLCMQLGLSYDAAERILRINTGIKNPTFTEGLTKVYVN